MLCLQAYEEKLKKLAQGNPQILFLGARQGKTLKELYSNAYIFVHPSEQEGLPLTVLEAASFGQPLLLSRIQSHQRIFEDLPFFFKNKNIESLRENLEFLLKNPELVQQRGEKIKKYSQQKYSWNRVVEGIILKYV